jgi:hypothetical protein
MPSRNVGQKRAETPDAEIPAELAKGEAQERSDGRQAESPVDSMHVDAPNQQDNERGHRREKRSADGGRQ